jgi:Transposase, Mutator family
MAGNTVRSTVPALVVEFVTAGRSATRPRTWSSAWTWTATSTCWASGSPLRSARFWAGVLTELRNRGVKDVVFVCCIGLTGLPDAIGVVAGHGSAVRGAPDPRQLAVCPKRYWVPLSRDLRPVYTAADETVAAAALEDFAAAWGERYPAIVRVWRAHWAEFTPFLAFPPEVRRVIYKTNLIWVFGSWGQRGRCFSGWRSPWPALTLNVIDAAGLSWTPIVGLAA